MELRQLRYFVRVVELGSISRAALDLNLVQSALSQQITRLEGELCTRLLQRSPQGVTPTEAGVAFFREAQLTLRHAEQATRAAQQARLTGTVSVGLAPTTAAVLGLPLMQAMRERYPDVRLHMVESLSGHLSAMLNARQLDLAVLFDLPMGASQSAQAARRWSVQPLIEEDIFLIASRSSRKPQSPERLKMTQLRDESLILPTGPHGLRSALNAAFARAKVTPKVVMEMDSLAMLMDAVSAGLGATLQPWAAVARMRHGLDLLYMARIADHQVSRVNWLCGLSDDELSPAALATRVVIGDCVRELVRSGVWMGASISPVSGGELSAPVHLKS
ncbi:MAG: LysR family transcriptional regulator [Betaproteobacteria bacterium]|nr:LysR family transcriptional regulator [Betaproteobacteria bacterium]